MSYDPDLLAAILDNPEEYLDSTNGEGVKVDVDGSITLRTTVPPQDVPNDDLLADSEENVLSAISRDSADTMWDGWKPIPLTSDANSEDGTGMIISHVSSKNWEGRTDLQHWLTIPGFYVLVPVMIPEPGTKMDSDGHYTSYEDAGYVFFRKNLD